MPVLVECPQCHKSYSVAEENLGRQGHCKQCGGTFTFVASSHVSRAQAASQIDAPQRSIAPSRDGSGGSASSHRAQARQSTVRETQRTAGGPTQIRGEVGQIGRFQVLERLGSGAFGSVYRAYDPHLERDVALKVPQAGVLENKHAVERFLREAKTAAQLRHPAIVPVYDAGRDGERYYIASAVVDGRTLAEAIEEGTLDTDQVAAIVMKLAEGLDYAHALGSSIATSSRPT